MNQNSLLTKLEKGLRFLAGLALTLFVFQWIGILTYVLAVWPQMNAVPSPATTVVGLVAVVAALCRSGLWIRIYWMGASVLATLRLDGGSPSTGLFASLEAMKRLLVTSSVLDFLLLPAIFLMDAFFPFKTSSFHLGLVQVANTLIPQTFGLGALILAYLAHQYGRLIHERCQMRTELALTI